MTDQELRILLSDTLPHENKAFLQSIREGGQDDGPYMVAARIIRDHIQENYTLAKPSKEVTDE